MKKHLLSHANVPLVRQNAKKSRIIIVQSMTSAYSSKSCTPSKSRTDRLSDLQCREESLYRKIVFSLYTLTSGRPPPVQKNPPPVTGRESWNPAFFFFLVARFCIDNMYTDWSIRFFFFFWLLYQDKQQTKVSCTHVDWPHHQLEISCREPCSQIRAVI